MGHVIEDELHKLVKETAEISKALRSLYSAINTIAKELSLGEEKGDLNGWIKINSKEDCPKISEPVLIRCEGVESDINWFGEYHVGSYRDCIWNTDGYTNIEESISVRVTHWKPIPKL